MDNTNCNKCYEGEVHSEMTEYNRETKCSVMERSVWLLKEVISKLRAKGRARQQVEDGIFLRRDTNTSKGSEGSRKHDPFKEWKESQKC